MLNVTKCCFFWHTWFCISFPTCFKLSVIMHNFSVIDAPGKLGPS
uniref:Uncharacterized protein n=1 Tax=Rhizophora mucronata TaxID=61149 RepID=A0A2P2LF79_RHIMU